MKRDLARLSRNDRRFAGDTNPFSDRIYHCIPSRLEGGLSTGIETKAGEKTGFDHIPRIVYAIFWRTVSRRALRPLVRGAFDTPWSPVSFFEFWPPCSVIRMPLSFRCGGLSIASVLNVGGKWTNARPKAIGLAN